MRQHPLSAAFPVMRPDEYQALKDSIMVVGVLNPITLYQGQVLDGWHRALAAEEMGMPCPSVELGDTDPSDFMLAQNKHRRHITAGQLAMAAAAVYKWRSVGRPGINCAPGAQFPTTAKAAADLGVSLRTMAQAKSVDAKGVPKVKEAAKAGKISVKRAAQIAKMPAAEQAEAIEAPAKPAAMPPKVEPNPEDRNYGGPDEAEIAATLASIADEQKEFRLLVDADDKLSTAVAEITRLNAEVAILKLTRDGWMTQCSELIRLVKSLRNQVKKATTSGDDPQASARLGTRPALQLMARMEGIPTPMADSW